MKSALRSVALALGFSCVVATTPMLARAQGSPKPGPEHEYLKQFEGKWTVTVKADSGESKGTLIYRMECGGLWLVSEIEMPWPDKNYIGRSFDGYDPEKKKFVSVTVDTNGFRPVSGEGQLDKAEDTLTMFYELPPGPDGKPSKVKSVQHRIDADHWSLKGYRVEADGKEIESFSMKATRDK